LGIGVIGPWQGLAAGHRPVVGPGEGRRRCGWRVRAGAPDGRAGRLGVWLLDGRVNSKDSRRASCGVHKLRAHRRAP